MSKAKGDAPDTPPTTPGQPLPGDQPEIDNSLPTDPPVIDNTLPSGGEIDNSLPPGDGTIDNTLPKPPGDPNVPGHPLPPGDGTIDNTLPGTPPRVDNTLPPNVDNTLPTDPPSIDNELPPIEPIDPDDQPDGAELMALMGKATTVLVVLCDAEGKPVGGIKAEKVTAAAFKSTPAGLALEGVAIEVTAPPEGAELAGYALIVDEKQVAWADRDPPITLVGNGKYSFAGDVVFPG